jgi:hypothetical protein
VDLSEKIRDVYSIDTSRYGAHFNPRPQPDAYGRRDATPLEVQKAISIINLSGKRRNK